MCVTWSYETLCSNWGCCLWLHVGVCAVGLLDSPFSSVGNMTGYRAGAFLGFFCWLFYCDVFSVLLQIYSRSIKHTFLPKLIIFYTFVPDSQLCCCTVIRKRVEQFPLVPHKHDVCVCVCVEDKPPLSSFSLKSGHCCFLELHGPDATVLLSSPGDLIRFGSCHVSGCAWFVFLFLNFCIK